MENMDKEERLNKLREYRFAHRGLHDKPVIPENSMLAFKRAVDRGFGIELDMHLTKDGQIVVIHDSSLKRTCGVEGNVEDMTYEALKTVKLEDSTEGIPLFSEVLKMTENNTPLIIEIKCAGGNHAVLTNQVCTMLENYKGLYCIESFDPRVVLWLKRNKPDIIRGQLATHFRKHGGKVNIVTDILAKNLLFNLVTDPDFVAYDFLDRESKPLSFAINKKKRTLVFWTIKTLEDMHEAEKRKAMVIFEQFDPEKDD